jgi:broad specificity phosphatase PhoE
LTTRILFVRHGSAGDRDRWPGDDRLRPLDGKGRRQAKNLVAQLSQVAPSGPVISSPYARCVETVRPLAQARGVAVDEDEDIAEGTGLRALDIARRAGDGAALCTHGDVMEELLGYLARHGVIRGMARAEKASTWVVELDGDRPVSARHLSPPA